MGKRGGQPISFGSSKKAKQSPFYRRENKNVIEDEEEKEPEINYLQPEILPLPLMLELLIKHGAKNLDINSLNKEEVAVIFYRHLSPKPQREYDDIHRVMIKLKKNRKKREKKSEESDWAKFVQDSKTDSSSLGNRTNDRLNPPPSHVKSFGSKHNPKMEVNLDDLVIVSRPKKSPQKSSDSKKDSVVKVPETSPKIEVKKLPINLERKVLKLSSPNKRKSEDQVQVKESKEGISNQSDEKVTASKDSCSESKKRKSSVSWP